jgi:hypothetical protein
VNYSSVKYLAFMALVMGIPATGFAQSATEDTGHGPAHVFGNKHELAISSDAALSITHYSPGDLTIITLAPAVDYFIIDNLSIGGFIGLDYATSGDASTTRFSVGPRVGYNLFLSDLVSLWPKIGFSFATTSSKEGGATDNVTVTTSSNSGIALNLFLPIMFHPAEHFFAGLGPFLDTDLSGDDKVTAFGFKLTIGGWLNT